MEETKYTSIGFLLMVVMFAALVFLEVFLQKTLKTSTIISPIPRAMSLH